MKLHERAYELRQEMGLSLQQAATRMGYTKSHLWEFEKGRSVNPTINFLTAIAKCYGLSLTELIGDQDPEFSRETRSILVSAERAIQRAYDRGLQDAWPERKK